MTKSELITQARKELLINQDSKKAIDTLNGIQGYSDDGLYKKTLALAYLENGGYNKAAELYKDAGEYYNAGFCELLLGNELETKRLWANAADSPALRWGKCIFDYIKLRKGPIPTYLQIRNHLEVDMGYFIQANKIRYAENLMKYDDIFISVNLESYKLIGRVLLNYGFLNMARKYFIKSLGVVPKDAETYFYLAKYNYQIGAYGEVQNNIERCLDLNQNHTPARGLLDKVKLKLNS